jgi:hypothetical protein
MPLPTTWHSVSYVGAARNQGSGSAPCPHPQVSGLCWGRQLAHRQVHPLSVRHVQRGHVRDLSEDAAAASLAWHAHGAGTGQCPIPPRGPAQTLAPKISRRAHPAVSAAIKSATGSHRARLETRSPHGDTQPVLRHPGRRGNCHLHLLRPLENTQFSATETMRHNLRRYV